MTVLVQVIILGRVEPFARKSTNSFEMFNEGTLLLVIYNFICFTPFVPDEVMRFNLGYVVCGVISANIVVNLAISVKATVKEARA